MNNSFLDKKSIQEITSIFRQRVLYQLASSKDQVPDITVPQQDKINRFLDCYHVHFHDYLIGEDTSQHMDFYRILSKEIKVFNFGKAQKFRKSHYDGIYIILKGSIEETILEPTIDSHILRQSPSTKLIKGKKRPSEQFRMSSIVNMVVGMNRLISCSSKDSLQQINEDSNGCEPNSPDKGPSSRFNKVHGLINKESMFSTPRPLESNEKMQIGSQLQQHPLKLEAANCQTLIKENSNCRSSSEFSTPAKDLPNHERISDKEPPKNLINHLSFTEVPGKLHKISSQKAFFGNPSSQVTETSPVPQIATFLGPHESSIFSESNNESNISQFTQFGAPLPQPPQITSNLSYRQGNTLAFKPNGSLSRLQSSIMLKQPFSFMDNAKRSHKIFYAGEAVNLTKVSESERKYSTSESEDSIYLYISKKSMQRAFHEQINQLQFKTSVLEKVFHNVPPNKILKLSYHMYERVLYKNQTVYNIGEIQPFFAYIIKSGEVQISEDINESQDSQKKGGRNQYGNSIPNHDSENNSKHGNLECAFGDDGSNKNNNNNTLLDIAQSDSGELQELCLKKLTRPKTALNTWKADANFKEVLCSVGESEIFGLEELVKKKETRYMRAIVSSSKAELFVLPAEHFNTFYQTEADSINLWFKQKELFYELQRNLLKRMKMRPSFTPTQPMNQKQLLRDVKKECAHLFQEDEDMFESKLDSLQKNNLLSLTKFGQYKSYTEMQHQQINQDARCNGNTAGNQPFLSSGVAANMNFSYSQKPNASTCISLNNFPDDDDEQQSFGKRSNNLAQKAQNLNLRGDSLKSQEQQQQVSAPTTINQTLSQKNQGIRNSQAETVPNRPSATETLRSQSERAIESKLLFATKAGNQGGKLKFSSALDDPQDLDVNTESAMIPQGQIKTNEYISSNYTGVGYATQASQPHLGRIYSMVKDNKAIAKQQLQCLGGEVNFKQPIFEELKSDNLKQALKYVHKHKQLLEARLEGREGSSSSQSPERFKSARMLTSNQNSIQAQLHSARGDQYHGLLKKMHDLENHKGQQIQLSQTQQTFGNNNNNNSQTGRSTSSTASVNNKLSPHLPVKTTTIHGRNSLSIISSSKMPCLTSDSSFSSAPIGQSTQADINMHMRYKRQVEKQSKPYLARTLHRLEIPHEAQKSFLNINNTHIQSNQVHLKEKKACNSLMNSLFYFPNKTSR